MELFLDNKTVIKKHLFSLKLNRRDGLLLQIHHTYQTKGGAQKNLRFIHSAFNEHGLLAVADHSGNIFVVDLRNEKYWQLHNEGNVTVIAFSPARIQNILVSYETGLLQFIDVETGRCLSALTGHSSPAVSISFSDDGRHCLTTSLQEAIIWDLETNSQAHKLTMKTDLNIKKAMFMPGSNNILACFHDDAMHVWKFQSFECLKQVIPDTWKATQLKSIAFTQDGRKMVVGGNTSNLVIFCLDTWTVTKIIELPHVVTGVRHLQFVPQPFDAGDNQVLALLTNTCCVHFLDISTSIFLGKTLQGTIGKINVSPHGEYFISVLSSGEANVYSTIKLLSKDVGKPASHVPAHVSSPQGHSSALEIRPSSALHSVRRSSRSLEAISTINKEIKSTLTLEKLKPLLLEFNEYPDAYRTLIWKMILQLPDNQEAYLSLVRKDYHPVYKQLEERYPLENKSLLNALKRVLSSLAFWCPLFGEVEFLPEFVFPFMKVFQHDPLACFEAVATILVNFCQHWFEYFPFPPINVLSMVENVLAHHDPALMEYFFNMRITSQVYAWSLLRTAFTEVVSRKEWLQLWDHVLSNEASFLLMLVVAYNMVCRNAVRSCQDSANLELIYHNKNAVDMKKLISTSYQLLRTTPSDIHPRQYLTEMQPLPQGVYTVYNEYPKFILDRHAQSLMDLRKEKEGLFQQERRALSLKREAEKKLTVNRNKEMHEARLQKLEETYRKVVDKEEDRLAVQRCKLQNLRHQLRMQELTALEAERDRVVKERIQRRQAELDRMVQEIAKKKLREETELDVAEEELQRYYCHLAAYKCQLQAELDALTAETEALTLPHETRKKQLQLQAQLQQLYNETAELHHNKHVKMADKMAVAEDTLQAAQLKAARELAERNVQMTTDKGKEKMKKLEEKVKKLEEEVEALVDGLCTAKIQEAKSTVQEPDGFRVTAAEIKEGVSDSGVSREARQSYFQWSSVLQQKSSSNISSKSSLIGDVSTESDEDARVVESAMSVREQLIKDAKHKF